jgi:uncharacterized membrane protein
LLLGAGVALCGALLWQRFARLREGGVDPDPALTLALLLAALGLLLVYAPEFVYLRDNFGTRMNTIFKFSYQAWLLFGLAGAFVIARRFGRTGFGASVPDVLSVLSVLGILAGLLYPVAGIVSKTGGFGTIYGAATRTLDAAEYIAWENSDEQAAIEWVRQNTAPDARVLEGKGASYRANFNRISVTTGRPTLLGWDGHEAQWRGRAYGEMASGRPEAIERIYRSAPAQEVPVLLEQWAIDYVYVGPTERSQYEVTPRVEERLALAMELVFESGDVRIYRRR